VVAHSWRVEDWHRVLKSGCRVEKIARAAAERIQRAAAINAVFAWRLAGPAMRGRAARPGPECEVYKLLRSD